MFVTHSSLNGSPAHRRAELKMAGVRSADTEPAGSSADPMDKLLGDWSWHPERQLPSNGGEVRQVFNGAVFRGTYRGLPQRPPRIGPRI